MTFDEIVSTGIDTTERKRADDALRASEERFRGAGGPRQPDEPLQHAPLDSPSASFAA
jgi:hypothetical protein